MTRTIVLVCFMVAFAAGLTVGLESHKRAAVPTSPNRPAHRPGWGLATELGLSPQQQEQLDQIWSDAFRRGGHEREERRHRLYRERDEAIAALIRPEDKTRYDAILKNYSDQTEMLDREWRASWEAAVEKTRKILTPDQRVKYEAVLKRHQTERGSRDWHHGERGRERPSKQAATSPAA